MALATQTKAISLTSVHGGLNPALLIRVVNQTRSSERRGQINRGFAIIFAEISDG